MSDVHGAKRLTVNPACDWGSSVPTAVQFILEMRQHAESLIRTIVYDNPIRFLSQSPKFRPPRREPA